MDKLKTLKDLRIKNKTLKKEAIKWIKYLFKKAEKSPSHEGQCVLAQANILIQFFDLTDEELE